jgi:hypothetical protein
MEDVEAGSRYDTFQGEAQPQPATLTRFDIVSLVFYLLSLLFVQENGRRHLLDIRLAISNSMRSGRAGIFSRRMTAPVEEVRAARTAGDDPELGVTTTGSGLFANAQNTLIRGGFFYNVVHQSDPAIRRSVQHIVYILSIQTAVLF